MLFENPIAINANFILMHDRAAYYKQLWGLQNDGEPFSTPYSLLQPVRYDNIECMLKITNAGGDQRGNYLMAWWQGKGAAKVLKHDNAALLMERAAGGRSLAEMAKTGRDDDASRILCDTIAKLHSHQPPYPANLMQLDTTFRDLESAASKLGGIFVESDGIAKKLLKDQREIVALHGDIHHDNVLDFGERGWLAIDPKGLIGERGFDYANIFCNPDAAVATSPNRLMQQLEVVAKAAIHDKIRLLQWIAAWAGLSAVWSFDDKMDPEPAITVAKMALAVLQL